MTLREITLNTTSRLTPLYGAGEAKAMTAIIMEHLKGYSTVDMVLYGDREITDYIAGKVDAIVDRLLAGEPIQYITGATRWHGLTIKVTPDVLIPRPETSQLVDIIVDRYGDTPDLRVLDLCTGSGCIAVALARALRFPAVTAVDISPAALDVARENARELKVAVKFVEADVLSLSLPGIYDIVVSNPPYVMESERDAMDANVLDHEPAIALFVPDDDALRFYRAIALKAATMLSATGRIFFEINPLTADALRSMMLEARWREVEIVKDIHGTDRFLIALRPALS